MSFGVKSSGTTSGATDEDRTPDHRWSIRRKKDLRRIGQRRKDLPVRVPILLTLLLIGSGHAFAEAPVRYVEVRSGVGMRTLELVGTVESAREATLAAEVAGTVDSLSVREGDRVRAGQALAHLRLRPLELQREALLGRLAEAEAEAQSAQLRLERLERLGSSSVVSPQNVDDARYGTRAAEGRVAQLRAQVARLDDELERATLRAPFDAIVTAEWVEVGEWLDVGEPVVQLTSVAELRVRVEVPERHFAHLRPETPVRVRLDADPAVSAEGRLLTVVPRASEPARMFPALVGLPADVRFGVGMLVRAEVTLDSSSALWVPRDAVLDRAGTSGPSLAETDGAGFVFVIDEGATVRRVDVSISDAIRGGQGSQGEAWVAVNGALEAGDRVVTRGNERLEHGDGVTAEPQEASTP